MSQGWGEFDTSRVPTPCFVIDEVQIARNLSIVDEFQRRSNARVLLALKAFACPAVADQLMETLAGVAASGCYEARLGREVFGSEVHTFSVAFREAEFDEVLKYSDHIIFNSPSQWSRFGSRALSKARHTGLRVNPGLGAAPKDMYDPCHPGSRLGATPEQTRSMNFDGLSGLHMHALCEQGFGPLDRIVAVMENHFQELLNQVDWINLGGGHLLTESGYDLDGLIGLSVALAEKYKAQVYLEPGEAIVAAAGVLVSEVLDCTYNGIDIAILDASATCHTPDVLEAPYRPDLVGQLDTEDDGVDWRLTGPTCLAGDVFGDYRINSTLRPGNRVLFADQAAYTMVKTNSFNGIRLPAIAIWNSETDKLRITKRFDYGDYSRRL